MRRSAPTPRCRSRSSTMRGFRPPITGSASPRRSMVQSSRPPLPSFSFDWVSTSIELDIERQIVASILSLATWPARSRSPASASSRPSFAPQRRPCGSRPRRGAPISAPSPRARSWPRSAPPRQAPTLRRELAEQAHANRRRQQARPCRAARSSPPRWRRK